MTRTERELDRILYIAGRHEDHMTEALTALLDEFVPCFPDCMARDPFNCTCLPAHGPDHVIDPGVAISEATGELADYCYDCDAILTRTNGQAIGIITE